MITDLPYPKPIEEQTLIEKLLNRAHIRKNAVDRKSVTEGEPDRLADLLEDAAETIMNLEMELAQLRSILDGTWPGCAEEVINDRLMEAITNNETITDKQFDALFKALDDRILFKFLAKYMRNCSMYSRDGGAGYTVGGSIENLRAVVEQELYERLTGRA